MNTLWLLQYNNYYNRIVKKETSLSGYQGYQVKYNGQTTDPNGNTAVIQDVNFIENDFVNTTQVVNWAGDLPDYLVVLDESQNIESRWFVVDSTKTRMGQLQLTLHRDLVVDFYEAAKDAPMFIEKATLSEGSPLIYNSEDMSFNQIKRNETQLKDESGCPWIVLYTDQKTELKTDINFPEYSVAVTYNTDQEFANSAVYKAARSRYSWVGDPSSLEYLYWKIFFSYANNTGFIRVDYDIFSKQFTSYEEGLSAGGGIKLKSTKGTDGPTALGLAFLRTMVNAGNQALERPAGNGLLADINSWPTTPLFDATIYEEVNQLNNQIIRVITTSGNSIYYRVVCTPNNRDLTFQLTNQQVWGAIIAEGKRLGLIDNATPQPAIPYNLITMNGMGYTVKYEQVYNLSLKTDIIPLEYTKDAPYNVLALPFSDTLKIKNSLNSDFKEFTANKDLSLSVAKSLILAFSGAGALYDAQLLPYCPLTSSMMDTADDVMDLNSAAADGWSPIYTGTEIVGYVFRIDYSSFSRFIPLPAPISVTNKKIENMTDLYRLSSPNFSSIFEFSAAKNNGITGFAISCTYKPFSPYIKVRPDFKGLYGSDFDDSRGLILGGDYSLPMTTDAWKTYELQNKNYQASFDRQILSMEINNNIARQQEKWQVGAGVLSATASGVSGGLTLAGPLGGALGGLGSGIVSAIAGSKDIEYNEALRREAMSLAKDQFGYQLGNIKALPIGLSKTSAYNIDNKYFPFLEYYTATDEEKLALANKIRNNGMTVGVIGKWSDYLDNTWSYTLAGYATISDRGYFKGQLISIIGAKIDSHIANAIASEFFQGVYLR